MPIYYFVIAIFRPSLEQKKCFGKGNPMFLIRTAFWLSLLILLLPTDEQDQRVMYGNAESAVKDLRTFCTRNPDICEASKSAAHTFGQKAQFGAKMVMNFIQDKAGDGSQTVSSNASARRPSFLGSSSQNTLTDDDLKPVWSIPANDAGI